MKRRKLVGTAVGVSLLGLGGCSAVRDGKDETTAGGANSPDQPADLALFISESVPLEGTMVKLGAKGTAINASSTTLADCVIHASGTVGASRYSGVALRERLEPDATWEWRIAFGDEADASDTDEVENLTITTQAEYIG